MQGGGDAASSDVGSSVTPTPVPRVPAGRRPDSLPELGPNVRGNRGGRRGGAIRKQRGRGPLLSQPARGSYDHWRSNVENWRVPEDFGRPNGAFFNCARPILPNAMAESITPAQPSVAPVTVIVQPATADKSEPKGNERGFGPRPSTEKKDTPDVGSLASDEEVEQAVEDIEEETAAQVFGMACTEAKLTRVKQVALQKFNALDGDIQQRVDQLQLVENVCRKAVEPSRGECHIIEPVTGKQFEKIAKHAKAARTDIRVVWDYTQSHSDKVKEILTKQQDEVNAIYAKQQENYHRVMRGETVPFLTGQAFSNATARLARLSMLVPVGMAALVTKMPTVEVVAPQFQSFASALVYQGRMEGFAGEGFDLVNPTPVVPLGIVRTVINAFKDAPEAVPTLPEIRLGWPGYVRAGVGGLVLGLGLAGAILGARWYLNRQCLPGTRDRKILED